MKDSRGTYHAPDKAGMYRIGLAAELLGAEHDRLLTEMTAAMEQGNINKALEYSRTSQEMQRAISHLDTMTVPTEWTRYLPVVEEEEDESPE
jgi:hypothetical protein